jgi:hypothetical protein
MALVIFALLSYGGALRIDEGHRDDESLRFEDQGIEPAVGSRSSLPPTLRPPTRNRTSIRF